MARFSSATPPSAASSAFDVHLLREDRAAGPLRAVRLHALTGRQHGERDGLAARTATPASPTESAPRAAVALVPRMTVPAIVELIEPEPVFVPVMSFSFPLQPARHSARRTR